MMRTTTASILAEHHKIAFADVVRDVFDEDWQLKSPSELNDNIRAAINSVEVTETTFGDSGMKRTVKVRTANKQASLDSMAKMLGVDQPPKEKEVKVDDMVEAIALGIKRAHERIAKQQ